MTVSTGHDSLGTRRKLTVAKEEYHFYSIEAAEAEGIGSLKQLPASLRVILENLLRNEDGETVTKDDISAFADWVANGGRTDREIAYRPARVLMQDFTGVPAVVDLAAMRDAMKTLGGDPQKINPLSPVDLVIDHSVMVDEFGTPRAFQMNVDREYERNMERYQFLKWGQGAFANFRVVPPGTGICHQVNLEYLAQTVWTDEDQAGVQVAYPDTLVGTDSHTTMVNGAAVLGWGVGGIEAEAAMLGQPISMLIPEVVGFELTGAMVEGTTGTDLVLKVVEMLREKGVVGRFVEFYGDGLASLSLADRATIANMAPEYGATCGIFPLDSETLRYLELTGRDAELTQRVEAYAKAQGLWREQGMKPAEYSDTLELDLGSVRPSIAGPKRPQDRIALDEAAGAFRDHLTAQGELAGKEPTPRAEQRYADEGGEQVEEQEALSDSSVRVAPFELDGVQHELSDGDVVIAAITSCTNTSNASVMMAAGLLAKKARARGLERKPWVKTSLAPGSQVVPRYLEGAGLLEPLRELGFHVVGFGCTTCIGNSGPLPEEISRAINENDLIATSVLSGNRNFEGRIHQDVRANYLASPPLVVAYAIAGSMLADVANEPLGQDSDGKDVYLADIWPSADEVSEAVATHVTAALFRDGYDDVFEGAKEWRDLDAPTGQVYAWPESTYVKKPPYFDGMSADPAAVDAIENARCLVKVGDSITTDHISPAGAIKPSSPAGEYLQAEGVSPGDFNSLGSRRGNHEVMMRGTFANVRLRNQLAPGTEGSATRHLPDGEQMDIYAAGMRYQKEDVPLVVLAGKEYGTGSSRDWAAKGTRLLGVHAVIAESYERIHRSNLIGFGVLPLVYADGESAESLGLTGEERFSIDSVESEPASVTVRAESDDGKVSEFRCDVRIDTPTEWDYYRHGGILHYVLRDLASRGDAGAAKGSAAS